MHHRRSVRTNLLGVCLALTVAGSAMADGDESRPASQVAEQGAPHSPFDLGYKYMTGDWGGARTELGDLGITFKVRLMNQIMVNMDGGKETKNGLDTAGTYDFNVYLDMEKLLDIPDATFWIRAKGTWGGDDSDFDKEKVGGLFKTNQDASAEEPIFVDKWHWQQFLFDRRLKLRLGRHEPVKDLIDRGQVMGHEDKYFMNRALVRNATIPATKGLGVFAKWMFSDNAYVSATALDAHAENRQTNFNTGFHDEDEYRFYAEVGCTPKLDLDKGELRGHYRIGTWYDPRRMTKFRDTFDGRREERFDVGDWGYYIGFDQTVWKENDDPKDKQGVRIAGRYGHADGGFYKIEDFWAFAAQYEGLLLGRDEDIFGIGFALGILADEYRRVHERADREAVYEMYYSIKLGPSLWISPDLQYITNAGGDEDDNDAFVAGLRFRMSL